MRRRILFCSFFVVMATSVPAQKSITRTNSGIVSFVQGSDVNGSITVESIGFGKNKAESEIDSKSSALYAVIFRGIAGSQYNIPMIKDEGLAEANETVKEILETNFNSFISSAELISAEKKNRKLDKIKGLEVVERITINCDGLRRYLEQKNVIRKFGY